MTDPVEKWFRAEIDNAIDVLVNLRTEQNLTIAEVSRRTGISQSNIQGFEKRRWTPSFNTINRYAQGVGKRARIEIEDQPS